MKTYGCCGAPCPYVGDPHEHWCVVAQTYGARRKPAPAKPAPLHKCTCGSGNRPLKGAGHSDWCDVERLQ